MVPINLQCTRLCQLGKRAPSIVTLAIVACQSGEVGRYLPTCGCMVACEGWIGLFVDLLCLTLRAVEAFGFLSPR